MGGKLEAVLGLRWSWGEPTSLRHYWCAPLWGGLGGGRRGAPTGQTLPTPEKRALSLDMPPRPPPRLQMQPPFGIASLRRSSPPCPNGCGCSSGVEHDLAKVGVEGSNPFARS